MIKINKPVTVPITLRNGGVRQTKLDCAQVDLDRDGYLAGTCKLDEKLGKIYGSRSVKRVLLTSHRNKCCYCERRRDKVEIDIEHFRPKSAVKQWRDSPDLFPGYYWLAYQWDNLYLSCKECNISKKGILFPLRIQSRRARWHGDVNTVANEKPLFIDPGKDEPSRHLRFRNDAPVAKTRKGSVTIEELDLIAKDRPGLREARLGVIRSLRICCLIVMAAVKRPADMELKQPADEAKDMLRDMISPDAEFSLMSRHFIEDFFTTIGHVPDFIDEPFAEQLP